jgi:hypothetical protein
MIALAPQPTDKCEQSSAPRKPRKKKDLHRNLSFRQRLRILQRDDFRCQYCGRDLLESTDSLMLATVDHIHPLRAGGDLRAKDNLIAACTICNQLKCGAEVASVMEARQLIAVRRASWAARFLEVFGKTGVTFPRDQETDLFGTMPVSAVAEMMVTQADSMARTFRVVLNAANPESIALRRAKRLCSFAWLPKGLLWFVKKRRPRKTRSAICWDDCRENEQPYNEEFYGRSVHADG